VIVLLNGPFGFGRSWRFYECDREARSARRSTGGGADSRRGDRVRATLGFPQWPVPFPLDELELSVERGELYVAESEGEIAATFTLLWDDPTFWGTQLPDAVYLHKLAVRRRFAGQGIGAALVDWVAEHAAAAGRRFVRLDCLRKDLAIRAYYERLGFEHRGDLVHPRFSASLYERPVPG
jgi:GNAT superfamily N-acetyltransferase